MERQNVKVQVVSRIIDDLSHQNAKVQFDWPKIPLKSEFE
ncbi:hypothetical protein GCM10010918_06740 [Paenibacillus radicis (ex Gao et al. 2016)]|uniref:Uncharacterized protein n=1 Tax=Paenibacillus radicis (ex Gao et al. 2016) TaxID=1737354 RepID=A0A917GU35_9BACL|nr:hypothetical protein GCM10010918_06740 [Paenibacillus radicis (ex Gao et al. 2016)]